MPTVIDLSSGSTSTWIESTYPAHGDNSVGRYDNFYVVFSKTVSMASLVSSNFKIFHQSGAEVLDAFRPIDLERDYNEITMRLKLTLTAPLDRGHEYQLFIDGLYDPAGNDQDAPHYVEFITINADVIADPVVGEQDFITAIDNTIINAPIIVSGNTTSASNPVRVVRTTPMTGIYNVDGLYNDGRVFVYFNVNVGNTHSVTAERRAISLMESPWSPLAAVSNVDEQNSQLLVVQLPESSGSIYFEPGYEYRVTVHGETTGLVDGVETPIGSDYVVEFAGMLSPMFTSVRDVLFYFPAEDPRDIARQIYLNSKYAMTVDTKIEPSAPSRAATDYALYATLYRLSSTESSASRIQLGDFQVQNQQGNSMADRFKMLMDAALSRLMRVGPITTIKGRSVESPFADRTF